MSNSGEKLKKRNGRSTGSSGSSKKSHLEEEC